MVRTKLTPEAIEALQESALYRQSVGSTLTVCELQLTNGCLVVGTSNVIDPANYDAELGRKAALGNAQGKIWELEGYAIKRDLKLRVEAAARAAHEANKIWCEAHGDRSQSSWSNAPEWQRESARAGVLQILKDPDTTPEQSHENWMVLKLDEGWSYGTVKDALEKTHPCLVPYADLPEEQKMKDKIFGAIVRAVLGPH